MKDNQSVTSGGFPPAAYECYKGFYDFCQYIPVISTLTHLHLLVEKVFIEFIKIFFDYDCSKSSPYCFYVYKKDMVSTCLPLFPVIGNVALAVSNYLEDNFQKEKKRILDNIAQFDMHNASRGARADKEIVLAYVGAGRRDVSWVDKELIRNNRDVALAVAKIDVVSCKFCSPEYLSDENFIREILLVNGKALSKAGSNLRRKKDLVELAVSNYVPAVQYAHPELKKDIRFLYALAKKYPEVVLFCEELQNNIDFLRVFVLFRGRFYKCFSLDAKLDPEIAFWAVVDYTEAIREVPESLLCDENFRARCLVHDPSLIVHFPLDHSKHKPRIQKVIKLRPSLYKGLPREFRNDVDVAKNAAENWPQAAQYFPEELLENKNFLTELLKSSAKPYCYLPERCRLDQNLATHAMNHGVRDEILPFVPEGIKQQFRRKVSLLERKEGGD